MQVGTTPSLINLPDANGIQPLPRGKDEAYAPAPDRDNKFELHPTDKDQLAAETRKKPCEDAPVADGTKKVLNEGEPAIIENTAQSNGTPLISDAMLAGLFNAPAPAPQAPGIMQNIAAPAVNTAPVAADAILTQGVLTPAILTATAQQTNAANSTAPSINPDVLQATLVETPGAIALPKTAVASTTAKTEQNSSAPADVSAAAADAESPTPAAQAPLTLSSPDDAAGAPSSIVKPEQSRFTQAQAPAAETRPANTDAAAPNAALPQQPLAVNANNAPEIKAAPVKAETAPSPAAEQVSFQIAKSVKTGMDRIKIQLSPEDLGRVEIRLDMHKDGSVKAVISADKPATAEWLQRDAKHIERALQDAGLKTDSGSLEFQNKGNQAFHNAFSQMPDRNYGHANDRYQTQARYATVSVDAAQGAAGQTVYGGKNGVNILV